MDQRLIMALVRYFITETIAEQGLIDESLVQEVGKVLRQKMTVMPFLIRTALIMMTIIFDWSGIFFAGRPFHSQTLDQQRKMVMVYQRSFLQAIAELMRFYKKMSVFIYFSLCPAKI